MTTVDGLRKALETKDAATATTLLADDVVFRSPAVHTPYEGKVATSVILHAVARVFEDFRVMIRPLKALHAVVDAMGREIPTAMRELGLSQDG